MAIDLSADLRKSLRKKLEEAKNHYRSGEDGEAAAAFEAAARLLFMLAEKYAPTREVEIREKKEAIRYRDLAKRLRAGDVPAKAERQGAAGRAAAADDDGDDDVARGPRGGRPGVEKEISGAVSQMIHQSSITWDQIGGLEETKNEVKYALGITMARHPEGVELQAWRNMLFYGPPGTGKTLLAAATSNALKTSADDRAVFFNVKVSSVLSKYFGESTKIISELYGTARDASPSVVFLDEFESLCGERDGDDSGAERRILSTILSELDGLSEKGRRDIYVLTIAATNRPWDLDRAVLSRFDKKILIPLPDPATRRAILEIHLKRRGFEVDMPYDELVKMTEGYSGREIERFCKEVQSRMIAERNRKLPALVDQGLDAVRNYKIQVRKLARADFELAAKRITPQTGPAENERYRTWKESELE